MIGLLICTIASKESPFEIVFPKYQIVRRHEVIKHDCRQPLIREKVNGHQLVKIDIKIDLFKIDL